MADPWSPVSTPTSGNYDQNMTPQDYFGVVKGLYPNAVFHGGGRTPDHNAAVGGVPDSMHLSDQALDFSVPGVPSSQVFASIHKAGVPVTEQLDEGNHLHMGWAPSKPNINTNYIPPSASSGDPWGPVSAPSSSDPWSPVQTHPAQPKQLNGQIGVSAQDQPLTDAQHLGLGVRNVMEGAGQLPDMVSGLVNSVVNATGGPHQSLHPATDEMDALATKMGLPTAQTKTDRIVGAGIQGATGGLMTSGAGLAGDVPGAIGTVAKAIGSSPLWDTVSGATSGVSSQGAAEAGAGPLGQLGAGLVGGMAPMGAHLIAHGPTIAASAMDAMSTAKRNYDVTQNLSQSTGGAPVSDFVKGLFSQRGMDTTPAANPAGRTSPITQDHIQLSTEDQAAYQHVLMTGDVDDIHAFTQGRQGPQPSYTDINNWVNHRDSSPGVDVSGDTHLQPQADQDAVNEYHRQAVEDHVNQQTQGWANAPNIEVVHGPEDIQDPAARAHAIATDTDPNGNRALGSFGADGVVRMYSGRIDSPELANSLLYHEGLGHYGLQQQFGDKLTSTMAALDKGNVGQFRTEVDARQAKYPEESRALSAEEVLAERSQEGPLKKSWFDAFESAARQYGRKMGFFKDKFNDVEVRHILAMAHDAVINGAGRDASANGYRVGSKKMFTGPNATDFTTQTLNRVRGSDGKLRNEISDEDARLTGVPSRNLRDTLKGTNSAVRGPLEATLDHPELYKQYPELRNLSVDHSDLSTENLHGAYDPQTKTIHLSTEGTDQERLQTLLHETQHAIQHIEGHISTDELGSTHYNQEDYNNDPRENEARQTEARQNMSMADRALEPAKFMREDQNALGRKLTDPKDLDEIERLKADPRFWADPEYRQNVIEKIRSMGDIDSRREPEKTQYKYANEAEARAAQGTKFMRTDQVKALQRDDDYTGALEETAKAYQNHVDTPMSFEETKRAAMDLGFSPSQIKDLGDIDGMHVKIARIGGALNAAKAKLTDLNAKLDTPNWSLGDKSQYIQTVANFNYLMEKYLGHGSEAGRMLNIIKQIGFTRDVLGNINDILKESGGDLSGLADDEQFQKYARAIKEQMDAGNDAAVTVQLKALAKPYREQYLTTLWHNMMLSSLATHFKSSLDMMTGIGLDAQERLLSMPIGAVRKMVIGGESGRTPQEALAYTYGTMRSIGNMEIARAAGHAVVSGEGAFVLPNKSRIPTNQNTFGTIQNPRLTGLARPLNLPMDMIAAQDTVFRSVSMAGHLYDMGIRQATEDLGKKATFDDVATRGSYYAHNPTLTMLKDAKSLTDQTLLMNNNALNTLVDKGRIMTPGMSANQRAGSFLLNMLSPFIRVESNNFWSRLVMRSPIGWVDKMTRQQLLSGGKDADLALARMTLGTLKMAFYWAAAGATVGAAKQLLTTNGPTNPDLYKEKEAQGWSPDSVEENGRFNGSDGLNANVIPWDLHNNTASLVASAREAYDDAANQHQAAIGAKLALGSIMHDMVSQTWVHDFQPMIDAATDTDATTSQKAARVGAGLVGNFYPNIASQIAKGGFGTLDGLGDPNKHDLNATDTLGNADFMGTVKNTLQARVPGLSQQLPIRYSVYGDPLQSGSSVTGVSIPGWNGGSPTVNGNGTVAQTDPAKLELQRLSTLIQAQPAQPGYPKPGALITPVQKTIKLDDGTTKKLTSAEFENYQHLAGINIVAQVREAMQDPSWKQMSDNDKAEQVKDIQKGVKADVREALFNGQ